jgi:pyridoxal phosphate enzyme (YggS family)
MAEFDYIKKNYEELCAHIAKISNEAAVAAPKLVCVTKSATDEELCALVKCGATAIGENRPGELKRRGELLSSLGLTPELHQIGTLQSNKAKLVSPIATLIHSLDSESLMNELNKRGGAEGKKIPVLIEINSAREPQKGGIFPENAQEFLEKVLKMPNLSPSGLMTMGPADCSDEELRGYFHLTKKLFDELNMRYGFGPSPVLSMGMSDSYELAIREGSTLVRVGRRLFIKN